MCTESACSTSEASCPCAHNDQQYLSGGRRTWHFQLCACARARVRARVRANVHVSLGWTDDPACVLGLSALSMRNRRVLVARSRDPPPQNTRAVSETQTFPHLLSSVVAKLCSTGASAHRSPTSGADCVCPSAVKEWQGGLTVPAGKTQHAVARRMLSAAQIAAGLPGYQRCSAGFGVNTRRALLVPALAGTQRIPAHAWTCADCSLHKQRRACTVTLLMLMKREGH